MFLFGRRSTKMMKWKRKVGKEVDKRKKKQQKSESENQDLIKKATACSTISQRWRMLCHSTTNLDFDEAHLFSIHSMFRGFPFLERRSDQRSDFVRWVHDLHNKHNALKLNQLNLEYVSIMMLLMESTLIIGFDLLSEGMCGNLNWTA
ncbi:hypothetical protein FNV43_RR06108 [Rhamnella rubrinervis]|uniref:Uncharacterized protein n=1 Tax=Rhamnella rubrinervis TaxID=2594499 RepID=A0A8K0HDW4_9ROSA|nr:hypothetical protein FNV43_RR06108 [Rhamnella rubrinervis]